MFRSPWQHPHGYFPLSSLLYVNYPQFSLSVNSQDLHKTCYKIPEGVYCLTYLACISENHLL